MKKPKKKIKQDFNPGFTGIFLNPFYFARKGLYKNISELSHYMSGKLLDIGCGQKPYKPLFNVDEYIGLEYDTPENRRYKRAEFFYNGESFPFENEKFDCAICNQVLEHVFNPDNFLQEINRILKQNSYLLLTVPFVWDEHEQPYDFARYSSFGLKHMLEKNGFEIIKQTKSVNSAAVIIQLINTYIYKLIVKNNMRLERILVRLLTAPFNILGVILERILPKNDDLYLDNIVLARKIKNA